MKIHHSGWGRTNKSEGKIFEPEEFNLNLCSTEKSGLAVGLGRSYGDSSINSEGVYFSNSSNKNIEIDKESMVATCESGATIGELERAAIANGLFPPIVPGTEFVTIGGAIASNIHGKSHHSAGSFSSCVIEITLLTSLGNILILNKNKENKELFWATLGGMGLTGIILTAKVKLIKIESSFVNVEEKRAQNIDEIFKIISEFDEKYLYTVAWVDLSGNYAGRGKVSGGNHASYSELPPKIQRNAVQIDYPKNFTLPDIFPSKTINRITVSVFNKIWFSKPLTNGYVNIRAFMHPLDSVKKWNRIYGKNGFYQFQFSIPFGAEYFMKSILLDLKHLNIASFLGVIKKFGESDASFLGFPSPGWTIAIDIPSNIPGIKEWMLEKNSEIGQIGGKIYLTKDAILDSSNFSLMYSRVDDWKEIKKSIDPSNFWQSNQGRRVGLC